MAKQVLEVRGLSKVFASRPALKGVDLELFEGEILGILGPNGAGKTTLIHCLLGLITPSSGTIRIFGLELSDHRTEILKKVNFASNYVSLPLSLTLWENLMVYALIYQVPRAGQRCQEMLRLFGLEDLASSPARRLSSGQMMRLCLAKALINDPQILLLDEPTAGLDPKMARHTRELLKRLREEKGLSVIYTSHNLKEMEEISDRVALIDHGEIIALAPAAELRQRFAAKDLEEAFFRAIGGKDNVP
ncbi:ABC transporter ATP-binding protein [Thermosulfuriphilus sp.]